MFFFSSYNPTDYGTFLEGFTITSLPNPVDVSPTFATVGISKNVYITGKNFFRVSNIYLSGTPYTSASNTYSPFLSVVSMSATYPSIFAYKVPLTSINLLSDHMILIELPAPSATGRFDIIVENLAGYGKLTTFCRHFSAYKPDYAVGIPVFADNQL